MHVRAWLETMHDLMLSVSNYHNVGAPIRNFGYDMQRD